MREIKFRGLSVEPLAKGDDWLVDTDIYINYYDKLAYLGAQEVKFETVSQYTGLKDKNGKEVYEGDVLKISGEDLYGNNYFRTSENWEMFMSVSYDSGVFIMNSLEDRLMQIFLFELESGEFQAEVIGNIYDNPLLLEVE